MPNKIEPGWQQHRGSALVELIVMIGICAVFLFSVTGVFSVSVRLTSQAAKRAQAVWYLREGAEALHGLRDAGWSAKIAPFTPGIAYFFSFNPNTQAYETTTTEPTLIEGLFARQFTAASVLRDADDNIAGSGTVDPGTRQITLQTAWRDGATTSTESLTFYLMDVWQN